MARRYGPMSSHEVQKLIVLTNSVLENVGIYRSPSWMSRTVRKYISQVQHNGVPFADFLNNRIELTFLQRQSIKSDPDYLHLIEMLMMPGNYAGRDHRKRSARHETGRR